MALQSTPAAADISVPQRSDDLDFKTCLGKGYFGEVWHAQEKAGRGRTFAVKKVRLQLITDNRLTEQLQREIGILYSLQHPRIVKLHFDFKDGRSMFLGMEFAAGGTLFDRLTKARKFSPEVAARYFLETCEALDYLHHLPEKVIHRDIKPENVLLDEEDHVKLADFGWANQLEHGKRDTFCGTLDYLPPEMITGTGHDESADMWNMGVLLYELTTGKSPFGSSSKETTCRLIIAADLQFPSELDQDARDLIASLCKTKPGDRLPVRGAMSHRFLAKFGTSGVTSLSNKEAEDESGRCSVANRMLRKESAKMIEEKNQLLEAKKQTESALSSINGELEEQLRLCKTEQIRRAGAELEFRMVKKVVEAREQELEEARKKADALKALPQTLGDTPTKADRAVGGMFAALRRSSKS